MTRVRHNPPPVVTTPTVVAPPPPPKTSEASKPAAPDGKWEGGPKADAKTDTPTTLPAGTAKPSTAKTDVDISKLPVIDGGPPPAHHGKPIAQVSAAGKVSVDKLSELGWSIRSKIDDGKQHFTVSFFPQMYGPDDAEKDKTKEPVARVRMPVEPQISPETTKLRGGDMRSFRDVAFDNVLMTVYGTKDPDKLQQIKDDPRIATMRDAYLAGPKGAEVMLHFPDKLYG